MTQRLPLPLVDDIVDQRTGKASQSWSRWFQDANNTLVTINDYLLNLAASNTGTNTGDQTITLSGAVTGSGTGAITTAFGSTFTVPEGGTGLTTMTTAYAPLCAGTTATGALQVASTGLGTSGYVLTSNGSSAVPSFQALPTDSDDWVYISTSTASGSSTIEFTGLSTYTSYQIRCYGVVPGTSAANLLLRVSVATAFQSGATDYLWEYVEMASTTISASQNTGTTSIQLTNSMHSSSHDYGGTVDVLGIGSGFETKVVSALAGYKSTSNPHHCTCRGLFNSTSTIDGIQFLMSSGTISTGVFKLYGIR